jgi:hypothetical protein
MSLEKIISIPGISGLFKMVAQMRNGGFIVESLADQKRQPVSSTQRIVMLEDISVYTMEGDMPLNDVFLKMKSNEDVTSSVNNQSDPSQLKQALKKIIPEFDEERVHASDIKKMFSWFSLLKDIITEEPAKDTSKEASNDAETITEATEEKPKKRAAKAKKTEEGAEEPVKKPRAKTEKK